MSKSINEIKEIVSEVAKQYGVERVYLFGSYARGEQREDSDIDLHVYLGKELAGWGLGGLYSTLEDRLGIKVGLMTGESEDQSKRRFRHTIMENILSEEILIYERS